MDTAEDQTMKEFAKIAAIAARIPSVRQMLENDLIEMANEGSEAPEDVTSTARRTAELKDMIQWAKWHEVWIRDSMTEFAGCLKEGASIRVASDFLKAKFRQLRSDVKDRPTRRRLATYYVAHIDQRVSRQQLGAVYGLSGKSVEADACSAGFRVRINGIRTLSKESANDGLDCEATLSQKEARKMVQRSAIHELRHPEDIEPLIRIAQGLGFEAYSDHCRPMMQDNLRLKTLKDWKSSFPAIDDWHVDILIAWHSRLLYAGEFERSNLRKASIRLMQPCFETVAVRCLIVDNSNRDKAERIQRELMGIDKYKIWIFTNGLKSRFARYLTSLAKRFQEDGI